MIKIQWLASIWRQNDQKCWVTSQNIQNNAKLQKPIKCNELHRLDVKTIKTKLNYKIDQNPMTCIDLPSKRSIMLSLVPKHSKQRKTTKPITLQWIASIGCQNYQNKAKLQKWSISNDLHRFDLKTINNVEFGPKTFKTTQNYKIEQNPMTCFDLIQNDQKCWVTSQNIQNNAKLQNRSNCNELHRLDVRTIKTMLNYESDLNYKSDQNPMTCIDLTSKR